MRHHLSTVHSCIRCGSDKFIFRNFGTEKIEEQLQEHFLKQGIQNGYGYGKGKHAHDALIKQFEDQRVDILVGTQMVVKGLDFDHVDLVGILDADGLLSFADFRVNEKAFQLMEQVSGRAGRKTETGKTLVQTAQPQHPVLLLVQQHDFAGFFKMEMESRKQFFYPPFSRIIHVSFKHKLKEVVERAAYHYVQALKPKYGKFMVGPAEPLIGRIRNQYISEILFKLPKDGKRLCNAKRYS